MRNLLADAVLSCSVPQSRGTSEQNRSIWSRLLRLHRSIPSIMSSWYDMSVAANPLGTKDQQCANESATEARASVVPPGSNSMENERPSEASNKRLACNPCRDRKVRCDRQHPTCGRCGKMGSECHYSSPSKQGVSKLDLSRLLVTLHNRLGAYQRSPALMISH